MKLAHLNPKAPPKPIDAAEVDACERALGMRFPQGYRELMTRYGRGILGGLLRFYAPAEIADLDGPRGVGEWRQRIAEYWFWDASAALMSKQRALTCIRIGDTVGGDELVFDPAEPERIYVLPHDFEEIYVAGDGVEAACTWFFTAGILDEPFEDNSFEPY